MSEYIHKSHNVTVLMKFNFNFNLTKIVAATRRARNPLHGQEAIALRVGRVIARFHMAKHFELSITETSLAYQRKSEAIEAEAALDGLYVVRTSLSSAQLDANAAVAAYRSLAHVERAFRSIKTVDRSERAPGVPLQ